MFCVFVGSAWAALPEVAKESWRLLASTAVQEFLSQEMTAGSSSVRRSERGERDGGSGGRRNASYGDDGDEFVVSPAQRLEWRTEQWHDYIGEDEIAALLFPSSIFSEVQEAFDELLDEFAEALNQWTAVMVKRLLLNQKR